MVLVVNDRSQALCPRERDPTMNVNVGTKRGVRLH